MESAAPWQGLPALLNTPGWSYMVFSLLLIWTRGLPFFKSLAPFLTVFWQRGGSSFPSLHRKITSFWKVTITKATNLSKCLHSLSFKLIILYHLWELYQSHYSTLFRYPVPVNWHLSQVYPQKNCCDSVLGFLPDKYLKILNYIGSLQ